jgi:translation elongation factor EF-Tu-like GTPase
MSSEAPIMSKLLQARICFLRASEGGRSTPAMSGVRPHLKVGEVFTSCVVQGLEPSEVFEPGREYDVTLELRFWAEYGHLIDDALPVELYEGSRLVAQGRFTNGAKVL